ncbi:MAG: hypothetical protein KC516_01185 [Nanoarchaeota archaeon]|nr:hypothetical protein [Nanoarchaeota archaeon]
MNNYQIQKNIGENYDLVGNGILVKSRGEILDKKGNLIGFTKDKKYQDRINNLVNQGLIEKAQMMYFEEITNERSKLIRL